MIHFDAHADTGDIEFGSLWGHGQPMRRLIESGALRGDRFLQIGLRGYWPPPETLDWMAAQNMRSYEMTEIVHRGLDECLTEAFAIATDECEGVFLSVDIDVVDPGTAPGTGTPEPGGLSARQLLDAVRRICLELPVVGMDVVEVSPAVRPRRHHRGPGQPGRAGGAVGDRPQARATSGTAPGGIRRCRCSASGTRPSPRARSTVITTPPPHLTTRSGREHHDQRSRDRGRDRRGPAQQRRGVRARRQPCSDGRCATSPRSGTSSGPTRRRSSSSGATPFNLLGLDRWVRNFNYITYYDAWDGAHPRVFTPKDKPYIEFESGEEINN